MDKNTVRELAKKRINQLSLTEKNVESFEVSRKLIKLLSKKDFKTLITYEAFDDEVDVYRVSLW